MFVLQKYKEFERAVRVEEINGLQLVKKLAEDMEEMFDKKAQAMKVHSITGFIPHTEKGVAGHSYTLQLAVFD
jgi:succinate dehydrogenase/fumarate reductase-like Fe-S protein